MTESPETMVLATPSSNQPTTPMAVLDAIAAIDHRLLELDAESRPLRERIGTLDRERSKLAARKIQFNALREEMAKGVFVSDHAVVRYLERRYGFDFEGVRREIMTPALREAAAVGAVGLRVSGGTFKIKGRRCAGGAVRVGQCEPLLPGRPAPMGDVPRTAGDRRLRPFPERWRP